MSITQFTSYIGGPTRAAGLGLALTSAAAFGTSGSFADALMATGWTPGAVVTARIVRRRAPAHADRPVPGPRPLARGCAGRPAWSRSTAWSPSPAASSRSSTPCKHLDVGVALLLEYLGIVLVVLWMWARHGQRPRRLTVAGVVAALTGLVLVLDPSGGLDGAGVAWGLAAATGLAVFFVASARTDPELPPLVVAWAGMVVGALTLVGFGLVGLLPLRAGADAVELFGQELSWLVPVAGPGPVVAAALRVLDRRRRGAPARRQGGVVRRPHRGAVRRGVRRAAGRAGARASASCSAGSSSSPASRWSRSTTRRRRPPSRAGARAGGPGSPGSSPGRPGTGITRSAGHSLP